MSFFQNTQNPKGFSGKLMVNMMNIGHSSMAEWGFKHIQIPDKCISLDAGCGGGANIKRLLKMCPDGKVFGIDYSEVSVRKSEKVNKAEITSRRCEILQGNVHDLPFNSSFFDLVTAFETVYFWGDIDQSFRQIHRVLKKNGIFMICNESDGKNNKDNKWTDIIRGMKIYTSEELEYSLKKSGFNDIKTYSDNKGWLCMVAKK